MEQLGLSTDELTNLASVYLGAMMQKKPELDKFEQVIVTLLFVFSKLIEHNNMRLSEQLRLTSEPVPKIDILSPSDANDLVAVSGLGIKRGGTYVKVLGELYNIAGYELSDVEIVAALYDERGCVVDRGTDSICDFFEGGKYVFEIRIFDPAPFVYYEVTTVVTV